ncbi:DUF2207 family protein [Bacillus suaedae]|uniref:DUF2207 domain-containing protein n=1 Tax=Halalkalibacter suaedae TaxID=2822140 RepID=A0A940WT38_9BACI|nr:DUF2207 domain-containing protein [Bacillus suaedae]
MVNRNGLLEHEEKLVEWLFDQIGAKNEFSFEDLTTYTKNKKNHTKYQQLQAAWKKAVRAEWKEANLYEDKSKYRLLITCLSLVLVPFAFLFVINDLLAFFLAASAMAVALFIFAISHKQKTWQGERIYSEWQRLKKRISMMADIDWQQLSEDERMRAFIYGLGVNEKSLKKKNESLTKMFKGPVHAAGLQTSTVYGFDPSLIIVATAATSNFHSAEQTTAVDHSSSTNGGGSGSGSGVGGGGGGSGAF